MGTETIIINHNVYINVAILIHEDTDNFCIDGELGGDKGIYEERSISASFDDTEGLIEWFGGLSGIRWIERRAYLI